MRTQSGHPGHGNRRESIGRSGTHRKRERAGSARWIAGLVASVILTTTAGCGSGSDGPPNVFLIVVDTARADHFSCYGHERETTPNIDALAVDAVVYTGARSPAPWTLPAHASMFTGHWPGEHGLNWQTASVSRKGENGNERPVARQQGRLLAERVREHGYRTFGVTNNAWVSAKSGLDQGFDEFTQIYKVMEEVRRQHKDWPEEVQVPSELFRQNAGLAVGVFKHAVHQGMTEPFFAFFNVTEPHFPYNARGEFRGRFGGDLELIEEMGKRGGEMERSLLAGSATADPEMLAICYDEEILAVDAVLGHLFDWLKEEDLYEDSMIIVTSDHGELLGEDGLYSHQLAVTRELLWVPLIVKYPGNHGAGTREDHPLVSTLDIYQTVLAAASDGTAEAETWSRDLARLDDFDRQWTLSEYYYSDNYLNGLGKLNPEFNQEAHRIVRRVVFTADGRHEFHDQEPADDGQSVNESLLELIRRYDRTVANLEPAFRGDAFDDAATLEHLREHGYIE